MPSEARAPLHDIDKFSFHEIITIIEKILMTRDTSSQMLFFLIFSKHSAQGFAPESHHTWIKLLNLALFFRKSLLCVCFRRKQNWRKIPWKFFTKRKGWSLESHERSHEAQTRPSGAPTDIGRATRARMDLENRLASSLRMSPYIP
jgi:hypothetical protein